MTSKSANENWRKREQPPNNFKFQEIKDQLFSCVIPASPNWYCSNVMASMNGYIAFGSKWAVYLINLQKNPPVCEGYLFGSPGYSSKITAVMFCQLDKNKDQANLPSHCALGMEDGLVKLINCSSKAMFREHRKHQVKISGISWSPLDNDVMVTGDEKGMVSLWNVEENTINVWIPIPNMISCLEMSPNLVNVAAIGYGNGNICVCNLKKCQIMQVFKSHIDEVCTLSWCPGYFKEKNCFVSGSKDLTMRLWDVCTEKPLSTYNMPKSILGKKKDEPQKTKLIKYHSVQWLDESQVLSSHSSGKILCWDLESHSWKALEGGHNRIVFAMRKDALTNQFVSISIDRQLIIWSCKQMKPAHVVPTVGGFLYSLTSTPLDPYSIAFGSGDNIIRVWNTDDLKQSYKHTTLWQGIKTKVMIVKYHPNREGVLAFGTEDGHVGCYNIISKKYDLATSYHRKAVYSLAWGPNCILEEDNTQINSLYSIGGEGTILMHKLGSFDSDSINISLLIKNENKLVTVPLRSEVSWRIDYLFVAIGNEDGSIDVLTAKLHCICRVLIHKKIINSLAWHHSYSLDTFGKSYLCWLASGSDDYNVCVTDVSDALNNNNNSELQTIIKPICQLSNQSGRITEVAWSPHTNGVLASASFDGSVQIWNILTGESIANYRGHIGRVYTVMWSYSDCDVLYTGGDDFTVHRWRISEQIFQTPSIPKKTKIRGKRNKATVVQQPTTVNVTKDVKNNEKLTEERVNATLLPSNDELPIFVPPNFSPIDIDKKKKRLRSLLKKSSVADSKTKEAMQTDCILLAQYLKAESKKEGLGTLVCNINPGSEEHPNLGLYASRKDAFKMLQTECKGHEENNSMEQLIQLETWRSNISGLINNAADNNSLNDAIVALSPLGGFDMWRACVLTYAEQLEKKRNFNSASLYFLAIGETDKAINVFKENGLFKEAVALAKVRLSKSNPLVHELYLLWAQKLIEENKNENAAECYLAAGKIDDAITILAKRGDSSSLLTAIKVADIYDKRNRSVEYLYRCIELLISEHKWDICGTLLNQISSVQVPHLRAVVNELLIDKLQTTDLVNATHQNHHQHRNYTKQEYFSNSTPFLENVLVVLETCFKITIECKQIRHLNFSSLKHERIVKPSGKDPKEVLGIVSDRVLFGIMSLLELDIQSCFKAWLFAFNALLSSGFYLTLISLFDALFPKSRYSYIEIKNKFGRSLQALSLDEDCFGNFLAFKCIGYLYKVWWRRASETISNIEITGIDGSMFNTKIDYLDLSDFENSDDALKKYDFFSLISFFKNILLSDDHIHYYNVIEQIDLVDRAIIERDIKHNLTAYLRTNNNADPKCVQNVDCEVRELVDSIVESVLQQFCLDGDIQIVENNLPVRDEKYNNIEQQRTSLIAEAESFKICVKEYAFPHPRESALVLERVCRFESDTRFKILRGEICDWISKNKITKSC